MASDSRNAVDGTPGRWRIAAWSAAAVALLLPLLAMQFTDEVQWSGFDFAVFGAMLATAGGACELAVRATGSRAYRAGAGVAVATAFVLGWANGAVGIIGSEDDPANLMIGAVLAVGAVGAGAARGRPRGMALALAATALAQGAVALTALLAGRTEGAAAAGVFIAPWLASAWLFGKAARQVGPADA